MPNYLPLEHPGVPGSAPRWVPLVGRRPTTPRELEIDLRVSVDCGYDIDHGKVRHAPNTGSVDVGGIEGTGSDDDEVGVEFLHGVPHEDPVEVGVCECGARLQRGEQRVGLGDERDWEEEHAGHHTKDSVLPDAEHDGSDFSEAAHVVRLCTH